MNNKSTALWVTENWAAGFSELLGSMTDEAPRFEIDASGATQPGDNSLVWQHALSISPNATIAVRAWEADWKQTGQLVLTSAGIDEVVPAEARNAFLEIVTQSVTALLPALRSRLQCDVKLLPGVERPGDVACAPLMVRFYRNDGTFVTLGLLVSKGLVELLESPPGEAQDREVAETPKVDVLSAPSSLPRTMDMLLDVELPVSVSFGRTQIRVREVLKFTTGSIVELHRAVTEPVEVIVNNCTIARGEVVVVEGNYGVRIHEIVSRNERLRSTGAGQPGRTERTGKSPA